MKLARPAPRQDRAAQLRRDQNTAPRLSALFPGVENLRFELTFESPRANAPVAQAHVLHPPARAYFLFPCPHADCDGRFELAAAVQTAVEDPSHRVEGVLECTGQRASDRTIDFASKPLCQLRLHFALTAVCPPAH